MRFYEKIQLILFFILLFICFYPFYPAIQYFCQNYFDKNESKGDFDFQLSTKLFESLEKNFDSNQGLLSKNDQQQNDYSINQLIIPSIKLATEIHEGFTEDTLHLGVWRRPNSSKPDEIINNLGNVVLTGHRFGYFNDAQRVFYNLDKVKVGDKVVVIWERKVYTYQVIEIREVLPSQLEIEKVNGGNYLTLYTCTPLFTSTHRLVIKAEFLEYQYPVD